MHYARTSWIFAFTLAAAPLGCDSGGGDDDGSTTTPMTNTNPTTDTPTGGEETGGETGAEAVSYTDIQTIWDGNCVSACHETGSTNNATGLYLEAAKSYAALVGPPSVQLPSMPIVTPGDPNASYLWHKLNGSFQDVGGTGLSMPFGAKLPQDKLDMVKAWIEDGANP